MSFTGTLHNSGILPMMTMMMVVRRWRGDRLFMTIVENERRLESEPSHRRVASAYLKASTPRSRESENINAMGAKLRTGSMHQLTTSALKPRFSTHSSAAPVASPRLGGCIDSTQTHSAAARRAATRGMIVRILRRLFESRVLDGGGRLAMIACSDDGWLDRCCCCWSGRVPHLVG